MTKTYVVETIRNFYQQLEKVSRPGDFEFNPLAAEIEQQIADLQDCCDHKCDETGNFDICDGLCKYCNKRVRE